MLQICALVFCARVKNHIAKHINCMLIKLINVNRGVFMECM